MCEKWAYTPHMTYTEKETERNQYLLTMKNEVATGLWAWIVLKNSVLCHAIVAGPSLNKKCISRDFFSYYYLLATLPQNQTNMYSRSLNYLLLLQSPQALNLLTPLFKLYFFLSFCLSKPKPWSLSSYLQMLAFITSLWRNIKKFYIL